MRGVRLDDLMGVRKSEGGPQKLKKVNRLGPSDRGSGATSSSTQVARDSRSRNKSQKTPPLPSGCKSEQKEIGVGGLEMR